MLLQLSHATCGALNLPQKCTKNRKQITGHVHKASMLGVECKQNKMKTNSGCGLDNKYVYDTTVYKGS